MDLNYTPSKLITLESYQRLKLFSSLKGFLKPFKGKGDWEFFEQQLLELREALNQFVLDMIPLLARPPWSLLNIELRAHPSLGTIYLRWRSRDKRSMGVWLWEEQMLNPKTPECLLEELRALEQLRIAINMQVSMAQKLIGASRACANKSEFADTILARRLAGETVVNFPKQKSKVGRKRKSQPSMEFDD